MRSFWLSELSGCVNGYVLPKDLVVLIANRLMTCDEHQGQHHFAIIRDGRGILFSDFAEECVKDLMTSDHT